VTFNKWPADDAVVPTDETLAGLLAFQPKPLPPSTTNAAPVFLLDSWRLAYRFDKPSDETYDNRYPRTTVTSAAAAAAGPADNAATA
jgi:hypothetical protein